MSLSKRALATLLPSVSLVLLPAWSAHAQQQSQTSAAAASEQPIDVEATDSGAESSPPPKPIDVVVSGERPRVPSSRRDPTAASSVVPRETLQRAGADAADVLERVPGVQVARTGSSADLATASIRGATSAQTPVYLAGIRLNDDVTGTADLSLVPLWMLHRAEVFRGNAPDDADRLGIGGAVFFEPRLPNRSELRAGAGVGSFGELSTWAGGAVGGPDAGSLVAVRREHADNDFEYLDDQGLRFGGTEQRVRRSNAETESYDAWGISRTALKGGGRITLVANAFRRQRGVPGIGVARAAHAQSRVDRLLGGLSAKLPCGGEDCNLELSTSLVASKNLVLDPDRELLLFAPWVSSAGERVAQRIAWKQRFGRFRFGLSVAQELERLRIDRPSVAQLRARREVTRLAGTLQADLRAGWGTHILAAGSCHTTAGPAGLQRCGVLEPAGRVGAWLDVSNQVTVLGNLGRYVRVPTLGELYGIAPLVRGNPDLAAETGYSADLGTRIAAELAPTLGVWLDGFVFARHSQDLVAYRSSSFGAIRPYNVGRSRTVGAELGLGADALRHVRSELMLTAIDPRDTTPERTLVRDLIPYQSRLTLSELVEVYTEPALPELGVTTASLGARLSYRASRVADPAGQVVIPGRTLLDVLASLQLWDDLVSLRGSVENLTGARHFDILGYPLPETSYHASVELLWR